MKWDPTVPIFDEYALNTTATYDYYLLKNSQWLLFLNNVSGTTLRIANLSQEPQKQKQMHNSHLYSFQASRSIYSANYSSLFSEKKTLAWFDITTIKAVLNSQPLHLPNRSTNFKKIKWLNYVLSPTFK